MQARGCGTFLGKHLNDVKIRGYDLHYLGAFLKGAKSLSAIREPTKESQGTKEHAPRTKEQEPESQPRSKSQGAKARAREPRGKSQGAREPRSKSQGNQGPIAREQGQEAGSRGHWQKPRSQPRAGATQIAWSGIVRACF